MWLFGIITEYRMVTLARKGWNNQMFPALERPVIRSLVYLTQDVGWLLLSTQHVILVLVCHEMSDVNMAYSTGARYLLAS